MIFEHALVLSAFLFSIGIYGLIMRHPKLITDLSYVFP